jgi:hypothetical protein
MKDTNEKMERIYNEMIMKKTPEERVKMCFSMLNAARRIVFSTIKDKKTGGKKCSCVFMAMNFPLHKRKKSS